MDRSVIDARAVIEAEKRGCACNGARNCGCWNLASRLMEEERETERKRRIEESGHNLWPRD